MSISASLSVGSDGVHVGLSAESTGLLAAPTHDHHARGASSSAAAAPPPDDAHRPASSSTAAPPPAAASSSGAPAHASSSPSLHEADSKGEPAHNKPARTASVHSGPPPRTGSSVAIEQSKVPRGTSMATKGSVRRGSTFQRGVAAVLRREAPSREAALAAAQEAQKLERRNDYYVCKTADDVIWELGSDRHTGLTSEQVEERQKLLGANELDKEEPESFWMSLLGQFKDPLVIMLIIASIASLVLGEYAAACVIILIVLANAILGVVQEANAEARLAELEADNEEEIEVIRNGKKAEKINVTLLVPGDIVLLETGSAIPADMRLITSDEAFASNEAALTGESEGVKKKADFVGIEKKQTPEEIEKEKVEIARRVEEARKAAEARETAIEELKKKGLTPAEFEDQKAALLAKPKGEHKEHSLDDEKNMVFMGCDVLAGRGSGVVVKIGMATKMGDIQKKILSADKKDSPLEAKLDDLGGKLGIASLTISVVVLIIGLTTGRGLDEHGKAPWLQMVLIAVSLTVAAVPEGLPACVTVTLAIGMARMAARKAIVRELHSVETLGSASVICSDKTGTLTAGKMTAVQLWPSPRQGFDISGTGFNPVGRITGTTAEPCALGASFESRIDNNPGVTIALALGRVCSYTAELFNGPLPLTGKEKRREAIARKECEERKTEYVPPKRESAWQATGNMTDIPFAVAGEKAGYSKQTLARSVTTVVENPFDSARKMQSIVVRHTVVADRIFGAERPAPGSETKDEKKEPSVPLPFTELAGVPYLSIVKGAPNLVLAKCTHVQEPTADGRATTVRALSPEDRHAILDRNEKLAGQTFRVIGVAYHPWDRPPPPKVDVESELVFVGLIAIYDPPREQVDVEIKKARHAGIRVVMITGDNVDTARAIAKKIGILEQNAPDDAAVECTRITPLGVRIDLVMKKITEPVKPLSDAAKKRLLARKEKLFARVDRITAVSDVYARAKPADKITIVRSLQRQGNICSMTGDGVNDAPALKQANIGVAMGITGTSVAKSAAKIILADDNFCSIVHAIEEGRTIYNNITKFVFYLLSTNVSEVLFILISVCAGLPSPLVPIQILWLNLVTDGAPAIALAIEPSEAGIMDQGPRLITEPLLEKVMVTGIVAHTVVLTGCLLGTYCLGLSWYTTSFSSWTGNNLVIKESPPYDIYTNASLPNYLQLTPLGVIEEQDTIGLHKARTMAILYIVFAELLRAYTSRSLRVSLFTQGPFSNKWMQPATLIAAVATVLMVNIPGVQDEVFKTTYIDGKAWGFVIGASFIPSVWDEILKFTYRALRFGERPKARRVVAIAASEDLRRWDEESSDDSDMDHEEDEKETPTDKANRAAAKREKKALKDTRYQNRLRRAGAAAASSAPAGGASLSLGVSLGGTESKGAAVELSIR